MSGAFRNKDNVPGKTTAFSKLRQPNFRCDLCVRGGEMSFLPLSHQPNSSAISAFSAVRPLGFRSRRSRASWPMSLLFRSPDHPMSLFCLSDHGDHVAITAIPRGCRGISTVLLKANDFSQIDPWVTPRFPLGHPDFSTGSPKLLLGSRKPSLLFPDQQRASSGSH